MNHPRKNFSTLEYSALKKIKQKFPLIIPALIIIVLVSVPLCTPSVAFRAGNLFFGQVPQMYNVPFASFFYRRAAYPLFSQKAYPDAHYQLSRTCFIAGNLPCSLTETEKELALYPEHYRSYYVMGLTYGYMGLEQNAIQSFKTYIKHVPDTWAGRNDLAWLQFRTGDVQGALQTIQFVAETQPLNPWLANTYGVMLLNTGQYEKSKEVLTLGYEQVKHMNENDWGYAYPGNDPSIYQQGVESMRQSFKENLKIVDEKIKNTH